MKAIKTSMAIKYILLNLIYLFLRNQLLKTILKKIKCFKDFKIYTKNFLKLISNYLIQTNQTLNLLVYQLDKIDKSKSSKMNLYKKMSINTKNNQFIDLL